MTDDEFETQVELEDGRLIHFQERWCATARDSRLAASAPPSHRRLLPPGCSRRSPTPTSCWSRRRIPSCRSALQVDGVRDTPRAARAPVVGVSPIIGGAVVRGMADVLSHDRRRDLRRGGRASARRARFAGGVLDAWLVDTVDANAVPALEAAGSRAAVAVPLWMRDEALSAAVAREAIALA